MNTISNLAKKSLKAYKTKNILVILTVIFSTCLITSVSIFAYSIQNMMKNSAVEQAGGNYHAIYTNVNDKQFEILKNNRNIEKVGEYIQLGNVKQEKAGDPRIALMYVSPSTMDMTNTKLKEGRLPTKINEIAIEDWVLDKLKINWKIGDTIHIEDEANSIKNDFVISGVLQDNKMNKLQNTSSAILSKEFILKNSQNAGSSFFVRIKNPGNIEKAILDVGHSIGLKDKDIKVNKIYIQASGGDIQTMIPFVIIGLIVIFATIIVIYNIFYISVIERIRQFGLLSALGATRKQIGKLIFREGLILSMIGIPLGIILGHILCYAVKLVFSQYFIEIKFSPYIILISTLISLVTVSISLRKPGKLSSKISSVEAIKYNGVQLYEGKKERASIKKITIFKIAYLNLWRNKKRTIMTMLSLTMSGILFITVFSVVKSMNIDNLTKQEFKHEFALTSTDTKGSPLNENLINRIKKIDGVKEISTEKLALNVFKDNVGSILYGYDDKLLNELKKHLITGRISAGKLKNNNEILVVTDYDNYNKGNFKYKLGDKINLTIKDNRSGESIKKQFTITGIVSKNIANLGMINYGVTRGDTFITHENIFEGAEYKNLLSTSEDNKLAAVYINIDDSKFKTIKSNIKSIIGDNNQIWYDSYTDNRKEIENQYMGIQIIAGSVVGIIGLIGVLNLINTMVTSILTRKKEYGMLEAVGLSKVQLRKMLQIEGLYYSLTSSLISLIVGSGLGYLCFKLFRKIGADYAEYEFPLISIVVLVLVFVIVEILISYVIENKLKKESIIDKIRYSE
ncbi:MAG: FtsX-like permease family protein [Clostridium sp.]|uniref:ABC transporter permease n=1 Tax=Clostridium sp. TaxID=1506 RepID=UPI0039E877CA